MRPRLLDLYCGAGGASCGYELAGFEVVGVDHQPQPHYPYAFIQTDVLSLDTRFLRHFDALHASPPCQAHTALRSLHNAREHRDLIPDTLKLLAASARPWTVENVVGAPIAGFMLCGSMFGLEASGAQLRRHRLFQTNWPVVLTPTCNHLGGETIGVYGGHVRNRRADKARANPHARTRDFGIAAGREAMGIDWMTLAEMSQAIPPAYTAWIGDRLWEHLLASGAG